jgi:DNA modification methylase
VEVNRILQGNALELLITLPDESAQAIITSPPYYGGLRDYQVPPTVWDGDDACQHAWSVPQRTPWANSVAGPNGRKKNIAAGHWKPKETGPFCLRCGAWYGCLGQEPTPQLYQQHLVQIFREARRVLRRDGVLWLNLGDSFWGSSPKRQSHVGTTSEQVGAGADPHGPCAEGLKRKDLIGVPWRCALALQADGWYLRADCVWYKPNCQPESCHDRPTKSHEYVFLFSKAPRYFYDADAIREPHTTKPQRRLTQRHSARDQAMRPDKQYRYRLRDEPGVEGNPAGRNRRTVWSVNTAAFDARRLGIEGINHFAVMPPALAEICVLSSTSPRACEVCGAPWKRSTTKATRFEGESGRAGRSPEEINARGKWEQRQHGKHLKLGPVVEIQTVGWCPSCKCAESKGLARCLILDPFAGAGTVLAMSAHLGRDYLGIELNEQYLRLAEQNILTPLNTGIRRQTSKAAQSGKASAGYRQLLLLDEEEP